jgi:hypothetical protein
VPDLYTCKAERPSYMSMTQSISAKGNRLIETNKK